MNGLHFSLLKILLLSALVIGFTGVSWAQEEENFPEPEEKQSWVDRTGARAAFVADAGLAVVRKSPSATGELKTRLRVGRRVYVFGSKRGSDRRMYCFIAVTRRTRGWIDARALVRAGSRGDDDRLFRLLAAEPGNFERLRLCGIFATLFPHSKLLPKVLLETGQTAEAEAPVLARRAERRVGARLAAGNSDAGGYFENDPVLDRYNRLGVVFRYAEAAKTYRYDGTAYRKLVSRFPKSPEAVLAREKLALEKLAAFHP